MPQEFKIKNGLIVDQGGATITGSVIATGGFTGSLQGTASWATNALTASAAGTNRQIQYNNGGVLAATSSLTFNSGTGLLTVNGSITTNNVTANESLTVSGSSIITGSLIASGSDGGIETVGGYLKDSNGIASVMWGTGNRILRDSVAGDSINWESRTLVNSSGGTTVDWENYSLNDIDASLSIDWENRSLLTRNGAYAFDYSTSNDSVVYSQLYIANITPETTQRSLTDTSIYSGHIIQGTIDASVTSYDIMYLDTDGTWKSLKNLPTVSTKMLGIEVEGNILIEGDMTVSDDGSVGTYVVNADHGLPVYLSTTTGRLTTTQPSSNVIRVVGHIYYQNPVSTNVWLMKFRPSNDWYEI
jgi:hypothetical protein